MGHIHKLNPSTLCWDQDGMTLIRRGRNRTESSLSRAVEVVHIVQVWGGPVSRSGPRWSEVGGSGPKTPGRGLGIGVIPGIGVPIMATPISVMDRVFSRHVGVRHVRRVGSPCLFPQGVSQGLMLQRI
jgi:hypothetical protein